MRYEKVRTPLLLLVCVVTLGMTSCGSNNEGGKILGKWKLESSNLNNAKDMDSLKSLGIYMYFEFKADNTFAMGFDADKKESLDLLKMGLKAQGQGDSLVFPGKYSLGSGDMVNFSDFKGPDGKGFNGKSTGKSKVKVNGDSMTITDADGTMNLVKVPAGK